MFKVNNQKIKLLDNKIIIIENFSKIIYFDDNNIKIDNIEINGEKLRIILFEDSLIKIEGTINCVLFKK